jgi:hypothetical protein
VTISPGGGTVKLSDLLENITKKQFELNTLTKESKKQPQEVNRKEESTTERKGQSPTHWEEQTDMALFMQRNPYARAAWGQYLEEKEGKYITGGGFTPAGRELNKDILKKEERVKNRDQEMVEKYKELNSQAESFLAESTTLTEDNIGKFREILKRDGILENCMKKKYRTKMRRLENDYNESRPSLPGSVGPGAVEEWLCATGSCEGLGPGAV